MATLASMDQRWRLRTPDAEAVRKLVRSRGLSELVASLLVSRGHTHSEALDRHLKASPMGLHDPMLLPGMAVGCDRLARAIRDGETILIHGDYDVDGVTGTSLLMRILRLLGAKAEWHIPNRLKDGYSFGAHSIERAESCDARVVVSVDNGTSAHEVIAQLKERGIDTVVTDHHEASPGPLPVATAIINPKLPGSEYPWRELCGGAVAFKLAWGLAQQVTGSRRASGELKAFLEEATAYVAIATVCDVVPLIDENRIFARYGLKALSHCQSHGLRALVDIAGLKGRSLTAEDVAFQIGPRLNASGRLGSAHHAVELLLADDEATARRFAVQLDTLNKRRREIEGEVLIEARVQAEEFADPVENPVLVLAGQGWHQGVVGIVAARITEEYDRPAIVIGLDGDLGRGSARTVAGFDVLAAMGGAADHLIRFGGHTQAAGLEIRPEEVPRARELICARAHELLADSTQVDPELLIDYELPFPLMNSATMHQLDDLAPFGAGNEKPILLSRALHLAEPPRVVGKTRDHLMLNFREGNHVLKAMAFRQGSRSTEFTLGQPVDVVYTPKWNTFRGQTNLELELLDFKPA